MHLVLAHGHEDPPAADGPPPRLERRPQLAERRVARARQGAERRRVPGIEQRQRLLPVNMDSAVATWRTMSPQVYSPSFGAQSIISAGIIRKNPTVRRRTPSK
jgi:hypothetical protein